MASATRTRTRRAPKPKAAIRRFDVFAEYNRQKAIAEGTPAGEAKGFGLWLAKVVAARKFRGPEAAKERDGEKAAYGRANRRGRWHLLGGEAQTDKLFDREIVRRMGAEFYRRVFRPAISAARERGRSYESIRDTLRKNWQPKE